LVRWAPETEVPDEYFDKLLQHMRAKADDPVQQASDCNHLSSLVELTKEQWEHLKPSPRQDKALAMGLDLLAIGAMQRFPSNGIVQKKCSFALKSLAQWNAPAFGTLGEHGAIEALAASVQAFPDDPDMLMLAGNIPALTDFKSDPRSQKNLQRLEKTGVAETVLTGMKRFANRSDITLTGLCFFSNACAPPALNAKMVQQGYLEDSVEMMRRHGKKVGVSGEVVWLADKCFSDDEAQLRREADAGLLEEVVLTLRAASAGLKTDVIGNERMFRNAMSLLGKFARAGDAYRARIVRAGAEAEILAGLSSGLVKPSKACPCLEALRLSLPAACLEGKR